MADKKRKTRKDGRVEVKITEGGKRISKYFNSSAEANAWRTQQKALQMQGVKLIPDRVLFGTLAETWMLAKSGDVRTTTNENYRTLYDTHINDTFAEKTAAQVCDGWQDFINRKKNTHSASTVRKLHFLLKAIMEIALDKDLIRKLPRIIGLPSPAKRRPVPMTTDQISFLLKAAEKSRYAPALWLELGTGLRRGEILALEWADLTETTVKISKSLERTNGGVVIQDPKTAAGYREIKIDALLMKKIKSMKRVKIKTDDGLTTCKILFCTETGNYVSPRNFSRQFASWIKEADKLIAKENIERLQRKEDEIAFLAGRRLHDMRHQFGALLADLNIHAAVAKQITGHAKEDMVLHYTNPNSALAVQAAEKIGEALKPLLQ